MLIAKIVVGFFTTILLFLIPFPIGSVAFYLVARPLLQPYATLGHTLSGEVPLIGIPPLVLTVSVFANCLLRKVYSIYSRQLLPLYALLFFSVFSFYCTPSYAISLGHCLKIITAISLYILVFNAVKNDKDIDRLLWVYLLCTIIPMSYGYYQFITSTGHAWKGAYYAGRRIDSLLMEYNAYGEFLCIAICAGLMLVFRKKPQKKGLILGIIFISLVANLILSLNRGSWICLLGALMFATPFYRRKINLPMLFSLCFLVLIVASPIIYQRFMELTVVTEFGDGNTLLQRIVGWQTLLSIIKQHFFTGSGIGAIELTLYRETGLAYVPHNDYIRIFAEAGILALLCYIWFHVENIRNIFRNRYRLWQINYPLLVAIIYFASLSFFQNIIYNVVVFPMLTGLLALGHKANKLAHVTCLYPK
jgi:hypothetical protein